MSEPPIVLVHATSRYAVVEKPSGMLSVQGKGPERADCACARVRLLFPESSGPVVVHRLDMETSGLLVFALDPEAQRDLSRQFESRQVEKRYVALLEGVEEVDTGEVKLALRPDINRRPLQVVDPERGRPAITFWRVISREIDRTRVEFTPVTGRTHQLRVHAAAPRETGGLGRPIVGDVLYGGPEAERLMLHAAYLSFREPGSERRVEFSSQAPF